MVHSRLNINEIIAVAIDLALVAFAIKLSLTMVLKLAGGLDGLFSNGIPY